MTTSNVEPDVTSWTTVPQETTTLEVKSQKSALDITATQTSLAQEAKKRTIRKLPGLGKITRNCHIITRQNHNNNYSKVMDDNTISYHIVFGYLVSTRLVSVN